MNDRENNHIKFTYISHSPDDTIRLGQKIGKVLQEGNLVALNGDLGAGKTCLIQGIASGLNSKDHVSSPSFSLIKEYSGDKLIYHFDLYRLSKSEELEELGYEEYFYSKGITLIEWAEKIRDYLPGSRLNIHIRLSGKHISFREIRVKAIGKRYQNIVKELKRDYIRN